MFPVVGHWAGMRAVRPGEQHFDTATTPTGLLLMAVHRASLIGYGRADLVRLLDAAGIEQPDQAAGWVSSP
ncbi:hypothetical protein [Streptomyces gilvus]|uniref:hypothetical protein n=1 Tax=Streptomyces gilvus TaxID=2920937 RepID=UPI001F0FEA6F|nr:hypothetical protein [Streptomyces sp. CME 23]MCH5670543.1 hypothetical protein [Streptomyces sp. CME 23]